MEEWNMASGHLVTCSHNNMNKQEHVRVEVYPNGCGSIILDRPKALHALNFAMVDTILRTLLQWRDRQDVRCVVFSSSSDRAFCAGGDIRRLVKKPYDGFAEKFFRLEYTMNHVIATYPKPILSLLRGIVMGGGCGIALHGRYRVVFADSTRLAMPET
eukprot:g31042.t1